MVRCEVRGHTTTVRGCGIPEINHCSLTACVFYEFLCLSFGTFLRILSFILALLIKDVHVFLLARFKHIYKAIPQKNLLFNSATTKKQTTKFLVC